MNKKVVSAVTAVALILLIGGTAYLANHRYTKENTGSSAASNTKIKFAYYGGTCEAPAYIAYEQGFFKKYGLDAEMIKVNFDTLKEGIATGKFDAVQVSAGEFKPIEQGLDIKITNGVHTGCIQGVVPTNSSIRSVKDLQGKNIGVEANGGVPMTLLSMELSRNGIDPRQGVNWKVYPSPQLSQALDKGEIDAFITWDPFGQLAVNSGKARVFFSNTKSDPYADLYCCYIGVNGKLAKEHPETAKAITQAMQDATRWVQENPDEAARISIEKKYSGGDIATTAQLLKQYHFNPDINKAEESLHFYYRGLKEQGIFDASTDTDQLFKNTFVKF